MLYVAAFLIGALGIAHSVLGERYVISWLLKHDLPKLLGDTGFAAGTIRFAWHITSILALGFAVVLAEFSLDAPESAIVATVGWTFIACSVLPIFYTRGRHLSWIVFLAAGALCLLSASGVLIQ